MSSRYNLDDQRSYSELGGRSPAEALAFIAEALRREARAAQLAGKLVLAVWRLVRAEELEEALERASSSEVAP